jgi:trans-2-enoyl-CoA reductase
MDIETLEEMPVFVKKYRTKNLRKFDEYSGIYSRKLQGKRISKEMRKLSRESFDLEDC